MTGRSIAKLTSLLAGLFGLLVTTSCATAPSTPAKRDALVNESTAVVQRMTGADPSLGDVLRTSTGYVVFPTVGKGGVLIGGAFGRGVVYEQGKPIGYAQLNQASFGATLGGKTFTELIVFRTQPALDRLKAGQYSVSGLVSVTFISAGAAAGAEFREGVAVFVRPKGGLMFDISIAGQRIDFEPAQIRAAQR